MKKILISIVFITTSLLAQTNVSDTTNKKLQSSKQICKDVKAIELKQRGCCSWHGGVSGCSNGRIVCNDGTYSPSCTCVIPIDPLG